MSFALDDQPRLSPAARLRFDRHSGSFVLLSPERALRLNGSATAILQRCTGQCTVREIVEALTKAAGSESSASVAADVTHLLHTLEQKRLVVFDPPS